MDSQKTRRKIRKSALQTSLALPLALLPLTLPLASSNAASLHTIPSWFDSSNCKEGSSETYTAPKETKEKISSSILLLNKAHELSTGKNVTIAVVDTGIARNNPALANASFSPGFDASGGDPLVDTQGHGTAVTSIIVGNFESKSGGVPVAPAATIVPVKVTAPEPASNASEADWETYRQLSSSYLASGIDWAAQQSNIDIISISIVQTVDSPALKAAIDKAVAQGKIVVAASGNATDDAAGDPIRYPAAYEGVIGVTAIDASGDVTKAVLHSQAVDISAPGQNVVVANGSTGTCLTSTNAPATSYSTAYVSGVAALVKSKYPTNSAEEVTYRLLASAQRGSQSLRSDVTGWGVINPYEALTLVDDGQLLGPDSPLRKREEQPVFKGAEVPPSARDTHKTSRESSLMWTGMATGVTLSLLIIAAGVTRTARRKSSS